ncbi:MAG: response regulator [Leptolyngbya sp. SIO4C1]|nr:response regulator [Leptolyngbya sp. SIO4C1]
MSIVLILENCLLYQHLLVEILEQNGFTCLTCQEVDDALNKIAYIRPDLIILEPLISDCRGLDFMSLLKRQPMMRYIPILLITAASHSTVKPLLDMQGGTVLYCSKPYDPNKVVPLAQKLIGPHQ